MFFFKEYTSGNGPYSTPEHNVSELLRIDPNALCPQASCGLRVEGHSNLDHFKTRVKKGYPVRATVTSVNDVDLSQGMQLTVPVQLKFVNQHTANRVSAQPPARITGERFYKDLENSRAFNKQFSIVTKSKESNSTVKEQALLFCELFDKEGGKTTSRSTVQSQSSLFSLQYVKWPSKVVKNDAQLLPWGKKSPCTRSISSLNLQLSSFSLGEYLSCSNVIVGTGEEFFGLADVLEGQMKQHCLFAIKPCGYSTALQTSVKSFYKDNFREIESLTSRLKQETPVPTLISEFSRSSLRANSIPNALKRILKYIVTPHMQDLSAICLDIFVLALLDVLCTVNVCANLQLGEISNFVPPYKLDSQSFALVLIKSPYTVLNNSNINKICESVVNDFPAGFSSALARIESCEKSMFNLVLDRSHTAPLTDMVNSLRSAITHPFQEKCTPSIIAAVFNKLKIMFSILKNIGKTECLLEFERTRQIMDRSDNSNAHLTLEDFLRDLESKY